MSQMIRRRARLGSALTGRELTLLAYLAEGHTRASAGHLMGISESTVKMFLKKIFVRLGAHNTTHAVAICYQRNLWETPPNVRLRSDG